MSERLEYLYQKNIENTLTEEEYLEFCKLLADEENDAEIEKLADASWEAEPVSYRMGDDKAEVMFDYVLQTAKASDRAGRQKAVTVWFKWAAVFLVMIGAGVVILSKFHKKTAIAVAMVEARATREHQLVKLPDGSTVILNANSFLKYPRKFGSTRQVTLIGEGYFDIRHHPDQPFVVHSGKLLVTVLGTAFNIKAFDQEKNIIVTVTRGKVSISDQRSVLGVITPNQQLSFNKADHNIIQSVVNSNKTIEWQSKDLFLDNMTMQQAATVLERRFNTKIAFANEAVKKCRFTGTFLHGEKIADILQVICAFNNATYETTNDGHFFISGPGCQ